MGAVAVDVMSTCAVSMLLVTVHVHNPDGTVEGGVLHEVKIISCNKTRYDPNTPKRAVDARADLLPQEYLSKARAADQKYNNTERGTVGPVERKLLELGEVRGIVSGNFGEVSADTHALV